MLDFGYVSTDGLPPDLTELMGSSTLAFDMETSGVNTAKDVPYGFSVACNPNSAYYSYMSNQFFLDLLANEKTLKVAHNAKFDRSMLKKYGVTADNLCCTMIASHLLEETGLSLQSLLKRKIKGYDLDIRFFKDFQGSIAHATLQEMANHFAPHSAAALMLWNVLQYELRANMLWKVFWDVEMPIVPVLSDMELDGTLIDTKELGELGKYYDERIFALEDALFDYAGRRNINFNSADQAADFIYEQVKVPKPPKTNKKLWTEKGRPTVDKSYLIDFISRFPIVNVYLKYKMYRHLKDTYVNGIMERLVDGRIHTNFNQTRTRTGRLSCVAFDTMIAADLGYVPAENVNVGDIVLVSNSRGVVERKWDYGKKPVVLTQFSDGGVLRTTLEHKFQTISSTGVVDFKPLEQLNIGDIVWLSLKALPGTCRTELPPDFVSQFGELDEKTAEFLGLCTAEQCNASKTKTSLGSNISERDVRDYFLPQLNSLTGLTVHDMVNGNTHTRWLNSRDLVKALGSLGMNVLSSARRVPKLLFNAPWNIRAAYLRGLFTGDGVDPRKDVALVTSSTGLAQDVRLLLNSLGIMSTVSWYDTWATSTMKHGDRWYVRVPAMSYIAFRSRVHYIGSKNNGLQEKIAETDFSRMKYSFGIGRLSKRYVEIVKRSGCTVLPVAIRSMRNAGEVDVCDMQVRDINQYVANGYITHNSTQPNLQNVPMRSSEGKKIRRSFIAPPGKMIVKGDMEQVELRKIACLSNCKALLDAFREGRDIHTETAVRAYNDASRRQDGKTLNFKLVYLGGTPVEQRILFEIYPEVKRWTDGMLEEFKIYGYARTHYGRRRHLGPLDRMSGMELFHAHSEGISTMDQGSCSEYLKLGMRKVWDEIRDSEIKMVLSVHDEVVLECPTKEVPDLVDCLKRNMTYNELQIPLTISISVGSSWGDTYGVG